MPRDLVRALGGDDVDLDPRWAPLRAYSARHGEPKWCRAALRHLARFLDVRGVDLATCEAADLRAFEARVLARFTASTRREYRAWIAGFFAEEALAGRAAPSLAIAAGAKPIPLTPDREVLAEFLVRHPQPAVSAALRALAGYLVRRGTSPLAATVADIEAFRREGLQPYAPATRQH